MFAANVAGRVDSCSQWSALAGYPQNVILESKDNNWFAWTPAVFFFSSLQFLIGIHAVQRQLSVFPLFSNLSCTNALITETMDSKIRLIVWWREMQGGKHCTVSAATVEKRVESWSSHKIKTYQRGEDNKTSVLLLGPHSMRGYSVQTPLDISGVWLNCTGPPIHMQTIERGCHQWAEVIMYDIWIDNAKGSHDMDSISAQLFLPALQLGGLIAWKRRALMQELIIQ